MDKAAVKKYYDDISGLYDNQRNLSFYLHFSRELAQLSARYVKNPDNILEIGCGTGISTEILRSTFPCASITAIDISDKMLEKARQKKIGSNIEFLGDSDKIFGQRYDLIFSSFSYHWWNTGFINKLKDSLSQNCVLALCVPARIADKNRENLLLAKLVNGYLNGSSKNNLRVLGVTLKQLQSELDGLDIKSADICRLAESFTGIDEFLSTLRSRGSLLALSHATKTSEQQLTDEIKRLMPKANSEINFTWKTFLVMAKKGN